MDKKDQIESSVTVLKCYDLVLWLAQKVEKYQRSHKFTIGDRTITCALEILESLTTAAYSKQKAEHLRMALSKGNILRLLVRLGKDLKLISIKSYQFISGLIDEVGKMSNSWLKSLGESF